MSRPCIICCEPGIRDAVDTRLQEGMSIRDIASIVQRSRSAIGRHKLHGNDERDARGIKRPALPVVKKTNRKVARPKLDAARQPTRNEKPIETREDLVDRFQGLLYEATAILVEARRRGDSRLALAALKEGRESVLNIGRALGLVQPDGAVFIDQRHQSMEVLAGLDEATLRRLAALPDFSVPVPNGDALQEPSG